MHNLYTELAEANRADVLYMWLSHEVMDLMTSLAVSVNIGRNLEN